MKGTVLILGSNGRFGHNAAEAFRDAGWRVRRYKRGEEGLAEAAIGADVIVNAWNPPYPDWAAQVPSLTRQVIAAAQASGATVIVPGNVYVFGADAPPEFGPDTPHLATNRLGRIRIEMEAAYRESGVPTIILRAGDFIDIGATGNWFDSVLTRRIGQGKLNYPGPTDRPHAWAYLPDLARAAVALAEMRDRLKVFEDIAFPGYTLTGAELGAALERALERPIKVARMSWLPIRLAAPFWPMGRGLLEMSYLWAKPHWLDGRRFGALLPEFRATPIEAALASAVKGEVDPDQAMDQGVRAVA